MEKWQHACYVELNKEAGLAKLSLQAVNIQGEKAMMDIFHTHYQHSYWDQMETLLSF